jgi:hypothetical protein
LPASLAGDSLSLSVQSIGYEPTDTTVLIRDGAQSVDVGLRQTVLQLLDRRRSRFLFERPAVHRRSDAAAGG